MEAVMKMINVCPFSDVDKDSGLTVTLLLDILNINSGSTAQQM